MPSRIVKRLNCSSTSKPDQRLQRRETPPPRVTLTWPDGIGRERVRATLRVEIAVEDVVPGAARAAHHEGADEEQQRRARDWGRGVRPRSPQARPTTSTAAATATRRSGGRRGQAADTGATRSGASVSTQFPVESATRPASLIGRARSRSAYRACRFAAPADRASAAARGAERLAQARAGRLRRGRAAAGADLGLRLQRAGRDWPSSA